MTLSPELASNIKHNVTEALEEDIGSGDLTAQLINEATQSTASIISRQSAIFCGRPWATEVFAQLDPSVTIDWQVNDGDEINADQVLCLISGPSRSILSGERCALNFLQTLSATATLANQYVAAVSGTGVTILDTRKTIPGLRLAQKYAVTCGGASNHRLGLYDGVLIKENHIEASGSLENAIKKISSVSPNVLIELEVETLDQLQSAIDHGVKRVLLDNMNPNQLRQAVAMVSRKADKKVALEASGGITLNNVREIAETGVDYISIGEITKDIRAVDLSLRFDQ